MKNTIKISILLLSVILAFSSCKKEEMSIQNPELSISGDNIEAGTLNFYQDELSISGKLAPEDVTNNEVTIKVTSDADPTGFEFTVTTSDRDFTEDNVKYLYKSLSSNVYAANRTDADSKRIKVGETNGEITITIGDNIISDTYSVANEEVVALTYFPGSVAFFQLYDYTFDGSENIEFEAWTGFDDQHIPITMVYNENVDQNSFGQYSAEIFYIEDTWSDYVNQTLGVRATGDTIFVSYNNKTYFSPVGTSTYEPLEEL